MAATKKSTPAKITKTIEVTGDDVFKVYEDVVSCGKDNFDALMKANTAFTQGVQAINQEIFSTFQATLEENAEASKKIFTCNTVQDVVAVQNDLVNSSYATAMDQSKKITDMSVKVTDEATAPLTKRANVTVETFSKTLAA